VLLDVLRLFACHVERVICHQRFRPVIIRVAGSGFAVEALMRSRLRQGFVVPNTGFPGTLSSALVRLTKTVGIGESTAVERHPKHDLVGRNALGDVDVNDRLRVERGAAVA